MKFLRNILLLTLLIPWQFVAGQHNNELYNNGAIINVTGGDVHVNGDVHMTGGTLTNDGTIEVQGNMYSNTSFQQRGSGTVLLRNDFVNAGQMQFISGSYAVRGGQSQIGVNDGSFYDLQLANDQGIVYLVGTGNIADVRNSVDFRGPGSPLTNRIVTHDIGSFAVPANGSTYSSVFGIMNTAANLTVMGDNSVTVGGNMSGIDSGYVQGRLRRAISSTGGVYGYVLGLEPAGATAARGMQYVHLDFGANNYDVIEGYFQQGSDNTIPGTPTECGYNINYFGGLDHGEWNFNTINPIGTGNYEVRIWPQDHTAPPQTVWFITKDNAISGTLGDCGPSLVGLDRAAFSGFSEFGFAGGSIILPVRLLHLDAVPVNNDFIRVDWAVTEEMNLDHYVLERSEDNLSFSRIGTTPATGVGAGTGTYDHNDFNVVPGIDYFYRLRMVDADGSEELSNSVRARLLPAGISAEFNVYPNPVKGGDLNIDITLKEETNLQILVVDALGRVLRQRKYEAQAGLNQFTLATDDLAVGPYMLHLNGKGFSLVKKFVKVDQW